MGANVLTCTYIFVLMIPSFWCYNNLEDFLYDTKLPSPFSSVPGFIDTLKSLQSEYEGTKKKRVEMASTADDWQQQQAGKPRASDIFTWMNDFTVDPTCEDWSKYFFRQPDGSCNWMKNGEANWGAAGQPFAREVKNSYADGKSVPRVGPLPREVSNKFFVKKPHTVLDRTCLLVGWVEFLIHDFLGTERSAEEEYPLEIPPCDAWLDPDCVGGKSMKFWRNAAANSSNGIREVKNGVSTWLDLSPLYGSSESVTRQLRTLVDGKMKTEIGPDGYEYLPLNNKANFPNGLLDGVSFPNQTVFATGDPRGNQDWMLVAVETLLLREHNRVCDLVKARYPDYDDERIFQTTRAIMGVKELTMSNEYQMSYFTKDMPEPTTDGLALFRQLYGKTQEDINVMVKYPFPYAMRNNKPLIASLELDIGYRFHEILPETMIVVNPANVTLYEIPVTQTAWNTAGFLETGLENIMRGILKQKVPSFHSGTSEAFRSMSFNFNDPRMGDGFDIVAWTIEHEREMGVPTYNQYFREYTGAPHAPPRSTFEEFTSNVTLQNYLRELYATPDDVDLYLGEVLDESLFPGTIIPTAQLITSLVSLSGLGAVDRFMGGYAIMRCVLVEKPWDCTPSNVVDELAWKPAPSALFPRARVPDLDWLEEMGLSEGGNMSLWKLITKNTNVRCVQMNPLLPADPITNPILCEQPDSRADKIKNVIDDIKVGLAGFAIGLIVAGAVAAVAFAAFFLYRRKQIKRKQKNSVTVIADKDTTELESRIKQLEEENKELSKQNKKLKKNAGKHEV